MRGAGSSQLDAISMIPSRIRHIMRCYWFDMGHQGWIGRCAKGASLLGLSERMTGEGDGYARIRIHQVLNIFGDPLKNF